MPTSCHPVRPPSRYLTASEASVTPVLEDWQAHAFTSRVLSAWRPSHLLPCRLRWMDRSETIFPSKPDDAGIGKPRSDFRATSALNQVASFVDGEAQVLPCLNLAMLQDCLADRPKHWRNGVCRRSEDGRSEHRCLARLRDGCSHRTSYALMLMPTRWCPPVKRHSHAS